MNFITSKNLNKFYEGKTLVTNQGSVFSFFVKNDKIYIATNFGNTKKSSNDLFSHMTSVQEREANKALGVIQKKYLNYNIVEGNALLIFDPNDVEKRHFLAEVMNVNQNQIDVYLMGADGKRIPQLGLYSFPINGPMSFVERFILIQRGLHEDLRDVENSVSQRLYVSSGGHVESHPVVGYHLTQGSILKHRESLGLPMEAYVLPENTQAIPARVLKAGDDTLSLKGNRGNYTSST